jgi:hypothetical protein
VNSVSYDTIVRLPSSWRGGTLPNGQTMNFTFYATFDSDSLTSYMPNVPVLLPASSWARKGLKPPAIPPHLTHVAADSGGFIATRIWGDYRYTLAEYFRRVSREVIEERYLAPLDDLQTIRLRVATLSNVSPRDRQAGRNGFPVVFIPVLKNCVYPISLR